MKVEVGLVRRASSALMAVVLSACASGGGAGPDDGQQSGGSQVLPPTTPSAMPPSMPVTPPPTVTEPSSGTGNCPAGDACAPMVEMPMAGSGAVMQGVAGAEAMPPEPTGTLSATEPTCFDFNNHGQPTAGDTSKYGVIPGEHYVCMHFNLPWTESAELTSWQTLYDNQAITHHWLVYSVPGAAVDGQFEPCIGTHLLEDAQLVAGWAVGGNDVTLPDDVGMRMPGSDRSFLIEWHYFNSTGAEQMDGSGVRLCVLPAGSREHTAGLTWLGTEDFNGPTGMPSGQRSTFSGTCVNDSTEAIHFIRFWPHMHQWGRQMTSVINRASGATEQVFDMPFDFNYQVSYEASVDLMPGESITSTCTFDNQSGLNVAFGPSTTQEMCYQFAFSWPAGALDNGVLSLVGATNTCW